MILFVCVVEDQRGGAIFWKFFKVVFVWFDMML